MDSGNEYRLRHWAYYTVGTAVGFFLIYLLISELGAAVEREEIIRALPVSSLVIVCFILPLAAATESWRLLFPRGTAPSFRYSMLLTWIGLGVNWLLPVATIGGELVKLRLAARRVTSVDDLVASLVGDKTIQVVTQLLYTLAGLSILAAADERFGGGIPEAAGLVLFCAALYLFYRLQRTGLFTRVSTRLGRFARDEQSMARRANRIDDALDGLYRRVPRWWLAAGARLLFRVLMAVEVALVLWWLGAPVSPGAVLALESFAQASRVAALVLPAALGAQEAVIIAVGLVLGYPVEVLFALAAVKRVRELAVGGAALIAWQAMETRRLPA